MRQASLIDAGEGGRQGGGNLIVVEAGDHEIPGDDKARQLSGMADAHGNAVVGADHSLGQASAMALQQLPEGAHTAFHGKAVAMDAAFVAGQIVRPAIVRQGVEAVLCLVIVRGPHGEPEVGQALIAVQVFDD